MITETEELDVSPAATHIQGSIGSMMETIEETVEEAGGPILGGVGKAPQMETLEEAPVETVEEDESPRGKVRKSFPGSKPQTLFQVAFQRAHLKKLGEWLLPYLIAVILVIGIGSAVLLISGFKTQQLNRQLQEQYGEYFADE